VLEIERLGDDDAEHGVPEELESLVRRQAAVLVGVRAMGESPLEELGVQDRIPERLAQLGIVRGGGQRTLPLRISAVWNRWSEDLATVGASAVLAALPARAVREVLGTARRVGAGDQGGRDSLPGRATVARVAARHLPLRDSHFSLL
jgi:hypothetical protein